jgi:hypothetical protein
LVVLVALAALSVWATLQPSVRARWHLHRIAPADVTIADPPDMNHPWTIALSGHAKAFVESPCARELLPELVALARSESEHDGTTYRALLTVVTETILPPEKVDMIAVIDSAGIVRAVPGYTEGEPWPKDVLATLASCLDSKSSALRGWTITKLPHDPRLLEPMLHHARAEFGSEREDFEVAPIFLWFTRFAEGHGDLISLDTGGGPWMALVQRQTLDPGALLEWVEANRSRLPVQIKAE